MYNRLRFSKLYIRKTVAYDRGYANFRDLPFYEAG
jgi:hypothetical protein